MWCSRRGGGVTAYLVRAAGARVPRRVAQAYSRRGREKEGQVRGKGDESEGEGCEREKSGRVVGGLRGTRLRSHNSVCTSLSLSLSRARSLSLSRARSLSVCLSVSLALSLSLSLFSLARALYACVVYVAKRPKRRKKRTAYGSLWRPTNCSTSRAFTSRCVRGCEGEGGGQGPGRVGGGCMEGRGRF